MIHLETHVNSKICSESSLVIAPALFVLRTAIIAADKIYNPEFTNPVSGVFYMWSDQERDYLPAELTDFSSHSFMYTFSVSNNKKEEKERIA